MSPRSSYDFRRWRHKLHDYQFALPGKKRKPPLKLRVDKQTWNGIVHLPDDVSMRTSGYFGPQLRVAHQIACKWWDLFKDVPEGESDLSPLGEFIISNYAECDASVFNALVGYYRQAGASLRFILEAILSGMYFSATSEKRTEFDRHQRGEPSVGIPYLDGIRKTLYQADSFKTFNAWLARKGKPGFLASKSAGCVTALYDELTEFSHGRMAVQGAGGELLAYSNVEMWASNGPVLSSEQFLRWFDLYCAAMFCCGALVRVYLLKPGSLDDAYLSAHETTMNLPLTEGAMRRVMLLVEYLSENAASQRSAAGA